MGPNELPTLSSTVRNKQSDKRFIGLRWSTVNRLLNFMFDEILFFAQKDSIRKVIDKKLQKCSLKNLVFLKGSY